jgi:hypothetical protein
MNIKVTLLDFATPENYLKLQNNFASQDTRFHPDYDLYKKPFPGDFDIIIKTINDVTLEEHYNKRSFFTHFLYPQIETMYYSFVEHFNKELYDKAILEKNKIELSAKNYHKKILVVREKLLKCDYLNVTTKDLLNKQIDSILDYLALVHINPNYLPTDKFKFKLNKIDLINLFILLRDHDIIDHKYDRDLGLLIDNSFLYFNKGDNSFKAISNSNKVINDYKNLNRGSNKSLSRIVVALTEILTKIANR